MGRSWNLYTATFVLKGHFMKAVCFTVGVLSIGSVLLALGGCSSDEARPDVPSNAMQVSSGSKVVAFTAPHDGKAFLQDDTDNRVVYSTELRRDQVMKFDPVADNVQIDGTAAPEGIAHPGHDHSIYFERSEHPDRTDVSGNRANDNGNGGTSANGVPIVRVPVGIQVDVQTQPSPQN
jgi:hypothetical protein